MKAMTLSPSASQSSPRSRCLLVTGGAGFIGSNFVRYWISHHPDDRLVVLDALTYAGNRNSLQEFAERPNFRFVMGNICDRLLLDRLLNEEQIDTIVHFAAESHVDRSILGPGTFIQTNVVGTFSLLESFRHHWLATDQPTTYRFLHVSTDEVYGSLRRDDAAFTETTPYAPNSPYSASKAGSDHLVRAYFHTYNLPTLITNCSNNYGPYQFPEKLIPLMTINTLLGKPLPVYGDGQNIRDWLYVEDHCRALEVVLQWGQVGTTYNIGGNNEIKNLDLVKTLCQIMDELDPHLSVRPAEKLITFVKDRPGHDRRYAIDITKICSELGWTPAKTFEQGLRETLIWYLEHRSWWKPLLSREYQQFVEGLEDNFAKI